VTPAVTPGEGIILASPSKNTSSTTGCFYIVDNLQQLAVTAGNGGYGDSAGTANSAGPPPVTGSTNEAPAAPGTYYGVGPQTGGKCNASATMSVPSGWKTGGF
jgi:hypothetical protein